MGEKTLLEAEDTAAVHGEPPVESEVISPEIQEDDSIVQDTELVSE